MANPYVLLGVVLGAVFLSVFSFTGGVRYANGQAAQAKVTAQIAFDKRLAEANEQLRSREELFATTSAQSSAQYQQLRKEKEDVSKKLVVAVATGQRKLYINAACPTTSDSAVSKTPADTVGTAGANRVELPVEIAATVLAIGGEADHAADLLKRCQIELANDRSVLTGQ